MGNQVFERPGDGPFGGSRARALHVGRIGEQQQHAALAPLSQAGEVRALAVDRGLIELEVAGVDNRPEWSGDCQGHSIDDAVGHVDPFERERTDLPGLARAKLVQLRVVEQRVFAELVA